MPENVHLPEWVQWIQAIGPTAGAMTTSIIAATVAFVAWRQWRTAVDKVALDLFDKRYQLFLDFMELSEKDVRRMSDEEVFKTRRDLLSRAHFLIGGEVINLLDQMLVPPDNSKTANELEAEKDALAQRIANHFEPELLMPIRRRRPGKADVS